MAYVYKAYKQSSAGGMCKDRTTVLLQKRHRNHVNFMMQKDHNTMQQVFANMIEYSIECWGEMTAQDVVMVDESDK